jgi:hypothetical protein
MSHAVFHRDQAVRQATAPARARRLPRGYGLLAAAIISLGLWAAIFWLGAQLIG